MKKLLTLAVVVVAIFFGLKSGKINLNRDSKADGNIKEIKVANWNVQNLFDMKRDGTEYKEFVPNTHNWTRKIYNKKIKNIAEVICDLDADVIGLEEIESDKALEDLQKYLNRVGCKYPYRAITSSKNTPIHTALLSKIKIKSKRDVKVRRSLYRSILEVTINTTPPLKIFVNHWSSKRHPESKRLIYAKVLRERLDSLPKGSEYIILGDFNSNYNEYKTIKKNKRLNDTRGKTGINKILGTTLSSGLVRLNYLKEHPHTHKLYNLWLELPKENRYSYRVYRKRYSLDSIIIPASLVDGEGWEYVEDSFNKFTPSYLFTKRGAIFKWQYKHKHLGKGYSDHLPIYATFKRVSKKSNLSKASLLGESQDVLKSQDKKKSTKNRTLTIKTLIENSSKSLDGVLKDVVVVLKRGKGAVVEDKNGKDGILIYGGVKSLKEGWVYDLRVFKSKDYYGMPEIVDMEIISQKRRVDISKYIKRFEPKLMRGDYPTSIVVRDVKGVIRDGKIYVKGEGFKIYFRGKRDRPKNGDKLIIKIAQIGYYKGQKEIIVWSKKDYSIK